ncbi:SprT-like protease [Gordonia phage Evaa]|nr:SprT-like protease [Gordonia phage Evaa]
MGNGTKFRLATRDIATANGWTSECDGSGDIFAQGVHRLHVEYTPADLIRWAVVTRGGEPALKIEGARKLDRVRSVLTAPAAVEFPAPAPLVASPTRPEIVPVGLHEDPVLSDTEPMTEAQLHEHAARLMVRHGLRGWVTQLDNAKTRAGQCRYSTRTLSFSRVQLALRPASATYNTITHEIAHALTPGEKHSKVWAAKHRELGGDGERCFISEVADPNAPWIGVCGHGNEHARYRQPRPGTWLCGCKGGRRGQRTEIVWRDNR